MRNLFKRLACLLMVLVVMGLCPSRSFAWGAKGHQIIAHIALGRLTPETRQQIADLLGEETLVAVSSWADQQGDENEKSWHFVAIPLKDGYYSPTKDCQRGRICIIGALDQQIGILRTSTDPEARAKALKYVVHLVGDLHQPFHVTTNTNPQDLSATKLKVKTMAGRLTNLHDVWDTELVEYGLKQNKSLSGYATQLNNKFRRGISAKGGSLKISTQGSITDWALEAHKVPWRAYYDTKGDFMVNDSREWTVDEEYYKRNLPIVELQLVQAGARLARVLNEAFGSGGKAAR
jgi:nuclease S1